MTKTEKTELDFKSQIDKEELNVLSNSDIDKAIDDIRQIDFSNLIATIHHAKFCQNFFWSMLRDVRKKYTNLSDEKSNFLQELADFIKTTSGKIEVKNIALEGDNCCRVVINSNGISKIGYKCRRGSSLSVKDLIHLVSDDMFMAKVNIAFSNDQILKLRFECLLKVLIRLGEITDNLAVMQSLKGDSPVPDNFTWNGSKIKGVRFEFGINEASLFLVIDGWEGIENGIHEVSSDFDDFVKIMPLIPYILPKMIELREHVNKMSEDFNRKLDSLKHELAPIYSLENI
jgi:hypothetical protein